MKKNILEKFLIIILFLIVFWQIIYPLTTIAIAEYSNEKIESNITPFGEILNDNTLVQEIAIDLDCVISSIDIQLANYASTKTNKNQLMLYKNEELVHEETISSESVEDNKYRRIDNINLNCIKGDMLKLTLTSKDGIGGQAITAWVKTDIDNNKLYRYNLSDGSYSKVDGELSMSINTKVSTLSYVSKKYLGLTPTIATILFIIMMVLFIFLAYQFIFIKEEGKSEDEINNSNTLLQ